MNGSARCLRGMPLKVCSTTGTILVRRLWNSAEAIRKSKLCSFPTNKFENAAYPAAIRKLQGRSTQPLPQKAHDKHRFNSKIFPIKDTRLQLCYNTFELANSRSNNDGRNHHKPFNSLEQSSSEGNEKGFQQHLRSQKTRLTL